MHARTRRYRWIIPICVMLLALPSIIHFQAASHPAEAALHTYSANPGLAIPDSPGACVAGTSVSSTITVSDNYNIADVNVQLNITHTFVGDLGITLTHGATTIVLVDHPGSSGLCGSTSQNNIITTLDDESGGGPVENASPPTGPSYTPQEALSAFDGQNANGNWTLTITDTFIADTGTLVSWGLVIEDSPLGANAACNLDNLVVNITAGDGPFNITGTGPGLPVNGVPAGSHPLTGPGTWTGVTVTETTGDFETTNLGNFNCATNVLAATAVCNLDNLDVTITAGDTPFNITGTGPGLPLNNVNAGTYPLAGPGSWTGVTVTEVGGNGQSTNLGNFNCATNGIVAAAVCQADNLVITITSGDTPFNITGTGAGLPQNGIAVGSYTLTGPGSWTGVTVTEVGGNGQSTNLGNFNCVTAGLSVATQCIADNLWVTILNGDGPFNVTGTGPGLPLNNIAASTFSLTGPSAWTGVTVTELGGNTETLVAGNFACQGVGIPVPNLGLIKIDTGQAQFALQRPNGDPLALTNGTPVLLPADADHNGFDTYTVTGIVYTDGDYWLSIFLGNTTWGWVPLDLVTPLTPLTLPESSTSSSK